MAEEYYPGEQRAPSKKQIAKQDIPHENGPRTHFEQDGAREPSTARLFQGRQTMTRTQTCQIDTPPPVAGR